MENSSLVSRVRATEGVTRKEHHDVNCTLMYNNCGGSYTHIHTKYYNFFTLQPPLGGYNFQF